MIFVTVGTNEAPFDRLLHAVAGLPRDSELVVQRGSSTVELENARVYDFMPFDDIVAHVGAARAVITHAGVGSVLVTLNAGKRPIVVARRREFGEAVDDHQLQLGRRFAAQDLVLLSEPEGLSEALELVSGVNLGSSANESPLVGELRGFIAAALGSHAVRA